MAHHSNVCYVIKLALWSGLIQRGFGRRVTKFRCGGSVGGGFSGIELSDLPTALAIVLGGNLGSALVVQILLFPTD